MPDTKDDEDLEAERLLADFAAEDGGDQTDESKSDGKDESDSKDKDWKSEYEAQKRINRALEKKSKRSFEDIRRQILAEVDGSKDESKVDVDAIRKQARDEAKAEALKERALDKLEAKAARLLANPEDARAFLAAKVDDFIDGESIDVEAISDALADLLKERPYLAVTQGDEKRFKGTADGGVHEKPAGKPQLTKEDVERLAREGKYGEIEDARQDGRLNKLLGIT